MKQLLSLAGVGLITGALLDPLFYGGVGAAVPWGRDLLMLAGGTVCLYLLVKYRRDL